RGGVIQADDGKPCLSKRNRKLAGPAAELEYGAAADLRLRQPELDVASPEQAIVVRAVPIYLRDLTHVSIQDPARRRVRSKGRRVPTNRCCQGSLTPVNPPQRRHRPLFTRKKEGTVRSRAKHREDKKIRSFAHRRLVQTGRGPVTELSSDRPRAEA